MSGSVKVIEAAVFSEPVKVPIVILWSQKGSLVLLARSGSSHKLYNPLLIYVYPLQVNFYS